MSALRLLKGIFLAEITDAGTIGNHPAITLTEETNSGDIKCMF
jgi:hypothetical protein